MVFFLIKNVFGGQNGRNRNKNNFFGQKTCKNIFLLLIFFYSNVKVVSSLKNHEKAKKTEFQRLEWIKSKKKFSPIKVDEKCVISRKKKLGGPISKFSAALAQSQKKEDFILYAVDKAVNLSKKKEKLFLKNFDFECSFFLFFQKIYICCS